MGNRLLKHECYMTTFHFFWDSNLLTIFRPWLSSLQTITHTLPHRRLNSWPLSLQTVIACTYIHVCTYTFLVISEATLVKSYQLDCLMWAGQGWHQWTAQTGWRKAHRASTLHRQLQATERSWQLERWSFPGHSVTTGHPVPNGQNVHRISITWTEQVILTTMSSLVANKRNAV